MAYKKQPAKGLSVLEKKIAPSKKYADVQSKLDTGPTVEKVKIITDKEVSKRKDEIHFRVSKRQLYQLYGEYEEEDMEDIAGAQMDDGGPRIVTHSELSTPQNLKPYLIYDVRDPEHFNTCHLLQARSYPFTFMRRDQIHPELYSFRNKPGLLIIIYDDDEHISLEAAKLLVQRGTDNVFVLTGGLFEFAAEYPHFVEGQLSLPAHLTNKAPAKISSASSRMGIPDTARTSGRSGSSVAGFAPSTAGTSRMGGGLTSRTLATSRTQRDDVSEVGSTVSVADSIISRAVSRKGKF